MHQMTKCALYTGTQPVSLSLAQAEPSTLLAVKVSSSKKRNSEVCYLSVYYFISFSLQLFSLSVFKHCFYEAKFYDKKYYILVILRSWTKTLLEIQLRLVCIVAWKWA